MAGAGKSTFSKALGALTGLPVIHLDLHLWDPGWVRVTSDVLLDKQRVLLAAEQWIVDSNDVDHDLLLQRADTLVVMATPWWLCAWRAFKRGLRRPADTQLPEGCVDSTAQRLTDEWGIVWRNWRNRTTVPARDSALAERCRALKMEVHVLRSKQEARLLIDRLQTSHDTN